jgi:hypothetical protein
VSRGLASHAPLPCLAFQSRGLGPQAPAESRGVDPPLPNNSGTSKHDACTHHMSSRLRTSVKTKQPCCRRPDQNAPPNPCAVGFVPVDLKFKLIDCARRRNIKWLIDSKCYQVRRLTMWRPRTEGGRAAPWIDNSRQTTQRRGAEKGGHTPETESSRVSIGHPIRRHRMPARRGRRG